MENGKINLDNISKLTPELAKELKNRNDINYVYIPKNKEESMNGIRTDMLENVYTKQEAIKCAEKMEELIGDLKNSNLSDLEKVMIVSKRINEGVVYDYELLDRDKNGEATNLENASARNLNSALLEGKTVCAGYADVFKQAMDGLGIPARYVLGWEGRPGDFDAHAWNQVQIDGNWYNLDLTFIDNQNENLNEYDKLHFSEQFLLNDKDMGIIHGNPEKYDTGDEYLATFAKKDMGGYFPVGACYGEKVEKCTSRSITHEEQLKAQTTIKTKNADIGNVKYSTQRQDNGITESQINKMQTNTKPLDKDELKKAQINNAQSLNKINEELSTNIFSELISKFKDMWNKLTNGIKSLFIKNNNILALPETITRLAGQPATQKVSKFREELKVSEEQLKQNLAKGESIVEKENSKNINKEDVLER